MYKRLLAYARFRSTRLVDWIFEHQINLEGVRYCKSSRKLIFPGIKSAIVFPEHSFVGRELGKLQKMLATSCSLEISNSGLLKLKWEDIEFQLTTAEEIYIAHEIIIEDTYNIRLKDNTLVLDVGMNVGFASIYFSRMPEVNAVIGYEPFPDTFDQANKNIDENIEYMKKIQPRSYGLGVRNEMLDVPYSPEQKGSMSLHGPQPWVDSNFASHITRVEVKKVDEEWEFLRTETRHVFVKLDCEGAEYEIIERLVSCDLIKYIYGFVIEWHRHGDAKILDYLHKEGFTAHSRRHPEGHIGLIYAFRAN